MERDYSAYVNENKEFYLDIECKFAVIQEGVYVHKMPDIIYIHGKHEEEKLRYVFETRAMTSINLDAVNLLRLCDGTRTVNDIIDKICEMYNDKPENVTGFVTDFLHTSSKLFQFIKFVNEKRKIEVELEETGSTEFVLPQHFALELTSRCNLKCKHCYRSCTPNIEEKEIPHDSVMKLLKDMHSIGARFIEITGGEAFLHPDIKEILTYVCENYNFVAVLTNGTLIKPEMIEYLNQYKGKIIWSISLDSYREDFHDEFRGMKGAYKKTVAAIKQLAEHGHTVRVAMSVSDGNIYDLEKMVEFVRDELKGTFFGYSFVMPYGRGKDMEVIISEEEKAKRIAEIDEFTDREEFKGYVNKLSKDRVKTMKDDMINCGAGWRTVAIGPDGVVRPCIIMEENTINIGNINEESIIDIMKQPLVNKMHDLPWPVEGVCKGCPNEAFCKWCSYRALTVNRERVNQGMGLCKWAKTNKLDEIIDFEQLDDNKISHCSTASCSMCDKE